MGLSHLRVNCPDGLNTHYSLQATSLKTAPTVWDWRAERTSQGRASWGGLREEEPLIAQVRLVGQPTVTSS